MRVLLRSQIAALFLYASFCFATGSAEAQFTGGIGPSKSQVVGVVVGIVAVGAVLGVGVYFLARRPPSLTGCAAANDAGLTLRNEGDQQAFTLIGDTAAIKPGNRIRVSGKKKKMDVAGKREFLVEKLSKDYGACTLVATTGTP